MSYQEFPKICILAICAVTIAWSFFMMIDTIASSKNFSVLFMIRMTFVGLIGGITIAFLIIKRPLFALGGLAVIILISILEGMLKLVKTI